MAVNPSQEAIRGAPGGSSRGSAAAGAPVRQSSLWKDAWGRYIRNKGAVAAAVVFILLVAYCLLIPVVTAAGPLLGYIVTGSFVIELIFGIPGIGRYYIQSVQARDYTVVLGITVLLSMIIIVANLVVDILYGFLDPRTRDAR